MDISRISTAEALKLLEAQTTVFIDVRDPDSYRSSHIPGALHVNDHNIDEFVASADKTRPHVVYCYHGYSSVGGAGYLLEQGFTEVSSMDGGFTEWAQTYPEQVEAQVKA